MVSARGSDKESTKGGREMKIENAIIDSATLRFEYDNRFLCLSLWLKTQHRQVRKFGGVSLGSRFQKEFNRNAGDYAFWWILLTSSPLMTLEGKLLE